MSVGRPVAAAAPDYTRDVAPIFAKYCAGCHNVEDREGELSLQSYADLVQGGASGEVIAAGDAEGSVLLLVLTGEAEPAMPPEGNEAPTEDEIAVIRAWLDAGAKTPANQDAAPALIVPEVAARDGAHSFITSLAVSPDGAHLALGKYQHVEVIDAKTKKVLLTASDLPGQVNSVAYSADGSQIVAAAGVPGLYGTAVILNAADGALIREVRGHRDAMYDARLSPDGRTLATCGYDRQIHLWDAQSGELLRTLGGHNGAVFELAFSADGSVLASASADETVKLWKVATGERLDTLGQPEDEQHAVAFSPDGKWIAAAGADRQIRAWRFVSRDSPRINPLGHSRFAHKDGVVELAYSPDGSKLVSASEGRELRLWDGRTLSPLKQYERQDDVVTGIAFDPAGSHFYVTRIDGSWRRYSIEDAEASGDPRTASAATGPVAASPAKPAKETPRVEAAEQEPNHEPASATPLASHALARGVIAAAADDGEPDVDLYRFAAKAGQQFVLEINAARQKSPLDSRIEVLDADGRPVPQLLLQAVRESYFTFRGHNSTDTNDFRLHRWEDMELNEYLYANGEVVKLWLYPRGPDSGFLVYPGKGKRYGYFGTTPLTHALNETCYIVEPHPPGTTLPANGLPQFTLYYENDDDGLQRFGADSRLAFTAPADGDYLVRVSDVRGAGGDDYRYDLVLRPPRPNFKIRFEPAQITVNAGSGTEIAVEATRLDGFDGEIRVEVTGLPPGFHCSAPWVIEAGQNTAFGVINADADAPPLTAEAGNAATAVATARINGKLVTKQLGPLGELKLGERPKLLVEVLPDESAPSAVVSAPGETPLELAISPGETITARVRVERNGFDGVINFGGESVGRNLPFGVNVDNLGLNGMTLLEGETERTFFITAAKWVPETTRRFHLRAQAEGNQSSWPVILHVREAASNAPPATADATAAVVN